MEVVLILVAIQGLLGAFDTLYHHEFTEKLPWKESARKELLIHGIRNFFYFVIFISLAWVEWHGAYAYWFGLIFCLELGLTLWDFVVEDKTRKLPATERITHTILTLNYGMVLAVMAPQWYAWLQQPSAFVGVNHGFLSWIASLYALGILLWTLRDLSSAMRSKKQSLPELVLDVPQQRFLITGGSGFIGKKLCQALINAGHEVTIFCRNNEKTAGQLTGRFTLVNQLDSLNTAFDVIINLAGEPISGKRWNKKRKALLLNSRLNITQALVDFIQRSEQKPSLFLSGSAIGYYGTSPEQIFTENTNAADNSFPHQLCAQWEQLALSAEQYGVRVVTLRTGVVLGLDGGALPELLVPFDLFAGGTFGAGQQWMSWIHMHDFLGLIAHIINQPSIQGAINATAPTPVNNAEFSRVLGKVLKRPSKLSIPEANMKILLGEMAEELLLKGQHVIPEKALASGYQFQYASLEAALKQLLGK